MAESRATMLQLMPDFWFEQHEWVNTEYRSAEEQVRRYILLVTVLGVIEEETVRAFAEELDPGDAEWILLAVREMHYWLLHLQQGITRRLMPPAYLMRKRQEDAPPPSIL